MYIVYKGVVANPLCCLHHNLFCFYCMLVINLYVWYAKWQRPFRVRHRWSWTYNFVCWVSVSYIITTGSKKGSLMGRTWSSRRFYLGSFLIEIRTKMGWYLKIIVYAYAWLYRVAQWKLDAPVLGNNIGDVGKRAVRSILYRRWYFVLLQHCYFNSPAVGWPTSKMWEGNTGGVAYRLRARQIL